VARSPPRRPTRDISAETVRLAIALEEVLKVNLRMWHQALTIMPRLNKEQWDRLDVVSKWLVSTRSAAIVMTFTSAAIAGILAFRDRHFTLWVWLVLTFGLVLAHATNNLLNDLVDYVRGVDRGNYFRDQYGPQPLELGLMSKRSLLGYAALNGLLAMAAGIALVFNRGGLTLPLMALGMFFVLFYTFPLKYIALGEISLLLVWGPLMVGGGYYVLAGTWDWSIVVASLPYALGVTATLFGKRVARYGALVLMVLQYVVVLYLILVGFFTPVLLVVALALPSFLKNVLPMYRHPRPVERPTDYPESAWPLWFVASAFVHARRFGLLLLLGLLVDAVLQRWIL
jgi:1,4-dihydroxy-2-naphthoate octaprenyltransferase